MKRYLVCVTEESNHNNEVSLTVLRVFAGLAIAFSHGLGKLPVSEQMIEGVTNMGFPFPIFFAWAAALSEFLGGIFLALGFLTRPAAFFLSCTMAVAAFGAHAADPFQKKEMALLYLVIFFIFIFRGAGKYSVDRFLR